MTDLNFTTLDSSIRAEMDSNQCCHDLLYTSRWAADNLPDKKERFIRWLAENGIACDCEVLNNFESIQKGLPSNL